MKTYSPTYVRGNSIELRILWQDAVLSPISFANRVVRVAVREVDNAPDVLFEANSEDNPLLVVIEELILPEAVGKIVIKMSPALTQTFPIGDLPYHVEVVDLDGYVRTILQGRLMIIEDIVR